MKEKIFNGVCFFHGINKLRGKYALYISALTITSFPVLADNNAQHLALLAQNYASGNAAGYATQQATSLASSQMQQWLEQFGNARVELGADSKFKTHSGSVDLLLPLYQDDDHIIFAQPGLRTLDSQVTGNFGLGHRHFIDDWMLGYNAFYDHNLSRGHKRLGLGGEVWRDYLKLSVNSYYRLSDWKASRDVAEYEARPANGFDLRAEGWLPDWPAIGGKLMYEQYYGNEVALGGNKEKRQKDPSAFTGGVSYTPFPLLTFTADHKVGSGISDTRFGMQVSYQLGVPVEKQLDRMAIDERRTLAGSAMDLVERNNNIVLEYRQQERFILTLPASISGASGTTQSIDYTLKSRHGLNRIVWNDAELLAAGGKVEALSAESYRLTLPRYNFSDKNQYTLSAVAYDRRNVASAVATTQIIIQEPGVDSGASSVDVADNLLVADGKSSTTVTVTLQAKDGQPLTNMAQEIKVELRQAKAVPGQQDATLGEIREMSTGRYQFSVTAGTQPGELTVTTSVLNTTLNPLKINQIADSGLPGIIDSDLVVINDNVVADGVATAEVRARVTDKNGDAVEDHEVLFSLSGSAQVAAGSALRGRSDKDGYVTVKLVNVKAETVTVRASTGEGKNTSKDVQFIADASSADIVKGSITSDKVRAVADGADGIIYTAIVQDAKGNLLKNQRVNWSTTAGVLSQSFSDSNEQGQVTTTLRNSNTGRVVVSAQVKTKVNADEVLFTGDARTARIDYLEEARKIMTGSGGEENILTATVKDAQGRPVEGQTVSWSVTNGGAVERTSVTNSAGKAIATLTAINTSKAKTDISAIADTNLTSLSRQITVRPVYKVGARYYWTLFTEFKTQEEEESNRNCRTYGGGAAADMEALDYFAANKGDFVTVEPIERSPTREFSYPLYKIFGTRSGVNVGTGYFRTITYSNGEREVPGNKNQTHYNNSYFYVCVKK
ncbi:inverse autotransporter beta domain-containing protein [Pantoea sp. A4]|uniref:inverse autotransporter beta domain-containing protein n=1 Tax=Pantoea sp. A4 TaxID=1225184 RepID=UPI00035F0870|nr:inverse autotransporter beta-barrel domain-containing protein [Pantoea sp. A4]